MRYQKARILRSKSFADVIAANIVSGKSFKSSVKEGISGKLKAHVTGIKEKFDPLNIASALTGGSSLAPALLGRMMGRDPNDVKYFGGNTKLLRNISGPSSAKLGKVQTGTPSDVILSRIFNFIKRSHDSEMKRFELINNKREEDEMEKQKRHNELVKALTGSSVFSAGGAKKDDEESGGLAKVFDFVNSLLSGLAWIRKIGPIIGRFLVTLFTNPVFLGFAGGILAAGSLAAFLAWLADKAVKYVPNFAAVTPQQAADILKNNPEYVDKFGGEQSLRATIDEIGTPEKVEALLNPPKNEEPGVKAERLEKIRKFGGEGQLRNVLNELKKTGPVAQPVMGEAFTNLPIEAPIPRPKEPGTRQDNWDKAWGKNYDPVTGIRTDVLAKRNKEIEELAAKSAGQTAQKLPPTARGIEKMADAALPDKVEPRPKDFEKKTGYTGQAREASILAQKQQMWDLQYGGKYDAQGNKLDKKETETAKPVPVSATDKLNGAVDIISKENQELNLRRFLNPVSPTETEVVSKVDPSKVPKRIEKPDLFKLDSITVRNPEETFREMIFYSTRVV